MNILLVGSYPPPYGGVSIHIQRLAECLIEQGHKCQILAYKKSGIEHTENKCEYVMINRGWRYISKFFRIKSDLIHDHSLPSFLNVPIVPFSIYSLIYLYLIIGRNVVVSIHSGAFPKDLNETSIIRKTIYKSVLRRLSSIICDNAEIKQYMLQLAIDRDKLHVINPFVPFKPDNEVEKTLPRDVDQFISGHSPLVVTTGWTFSQIYRFEIVIKTVSRLKEKFPNIGLLIIVSNYVADEARKKLTLETIRECNLEQDIEFVTDIPEISPIYKKSNLMIRATTSDGDSISVKEALYLGIPVLATDVSHRPRECILFNIDDEGDLCKKALNILEKKITSYSGEDIASQARHNLKQIIKVYENVITKRG